MMWRDRKFRNIRPSLLTATAALTILGLSMMLGGMLGG